MAHFALVQNGVVQEVIVIDNANCGNEDYPESEPIGQDFIAACGLEGNWLQTSYSDAYRGQFAGKGYLYNSELDIFQAPTNEEIPE